MAFTKRLTNTFDVPLTWAQDLEDKRMVFLNQQIAEGKTDGKITVTDLTLSMDFVDQESAEAYTQASLAWNVGRNLVSSVITDI